jgi:hypothetical protein
MSVSIHSVNKLMMFPFVACHGGRLSPVAGTQESQG